MRWNSVKKTARWAVFRNSPEGFSLRGLVARSAARNPLQATIEYCRSGDCLACFGLKPVLMNGLLFETARSCVAGSSFGCCISFGLRGAIVYSLCSRANPPFCSGSSPSFDECFHSHFSCHKKPKWGLIAASFRKKIVCLDVTLKAVVLKTPGQTNSGVLCLLQDFLRGRFVAAPRGPMVAYFDKMSCNRCNEAPSCGFLSSVDSCRLLSGAIRR